MNWSSDSQKKKEVRLSQTDRETVWLRSAGSDVRGRAGTGPSGQGAGVSATREKPLELSDWSSQWALLTGASCKYQDPGQAGYEGQCKRVHDQTHAVIQGVRYVGSGSVFLQHSPEWWMKGTQRITNRNSEAFVQSCMLSSQAAASCFHCLVNFSLRQDITVSSEGLPITGSPALPLLNILIAWPQPEFQWARKLPRQGPQRPTAHDRGRHPVAFLSSGFLLTRSIKKVSNHCYHVLEAPLSKQKAF